MNAKKIMPKTARTTATKATATKPAAEKKAKGRRPAAEAEAISTLPPVDALGGTPIDVALKMLVLSDQNPRKGQRDEADRALMGADIAAHGLLSRLPVKANEDGTYEVIIGSRRMGGLGWLVEQGRLTGEDLVGCLLKPRLADPVADAADSHELATAENVGRRDMHPVDEFEAFARMADEGKTVDAIAAAFGISVHHVRQRLKLGRVAPTLRELCREGKLSVEQLAAFTVSDDHAAQERYHAENHRSHWQMRPDSIRSAFISAHVQGSDRRVKFVGRKAYLAAGGGITEDLFAQGDDAKAYFADAALLDRLTVEKLTAKAEALVKAEGWKWAAVELGDAYEARRGFSTVHPAHAPEVAAKIERLATRLGGLDDDNDPKGKKREKVRAEIKEASATPKSYSADQLAVAGVLVCLDHQGRVVEHRGLVRPEDLAQAQAQDDAGGGSASLTVNPGRPGRPGSGSAAGGAGGDAAPALAHSLVESLTTERTIALRAAVAGNQHVALVAAVHKFCNVFYDFSVDSAVKGVIHGNTIAITEAMKASKGFAEIEAQVARVTAILPESRGDLWTFLLTQDQAALLDILTVAVARSIYAVKKQYQDSEGTGHLSHANQLAQALGFDMSALWRPTAANYWGRISTAQIAEQIGEAVSPAEGAAIRKMKKGDAAATAERLTAGTAWLPELLRADTAEQAPDPEDIEDEDAEDLDGDESGGEAATDDEAAA
jgi:ParB family chromosome partitioning protein